MASERFAYIWRYTIDPDCRSAFLAAYNPNGDWAKLFSRDPSYMETLLVQDVENENQYLTVDFWKSKADRNSFRERYAVEFENLDRLCEEFTMAEEFLGDYLEIAESSM